jgi:conjugal transfer pilus assembly protein TraB
LMAPGSQVRDVDTWVGQAGRELEKHRTAREEQQRVNKELTEARDAMLRRLGELEARLKSAQPREPARPAAAPVPPPPGSSPAFPQEAALAQQRHLPPPPPPPAAANRMPPAVPAAGPPAQALNPPPPALVRVTLAQPKAEQAGAAGRKNPQTVETFLPVSFTRGVLLGGVDAPTGGQAQANPHPILIRLSDNSVLPNRFRAEYRECFVVAAAYGEISSERAYGRTESLSCVRQDGRALEVKIQGAIFGEDGKVGMRGRVVTKQGQMLANALMAGIVSGLGQGLATTHTTFSTSALGAIATTSGADAFKAGVGSGVGRALDRLARYYIRLAEQTFPIIEIDAGREVDVVLTRGVRIDESELAAQASPAPHPQRLVEPSERYAKVNDEN